MLAQNRTRRVSGFILIVLGTLIGGRMLWMCITLGEWFHEAAWLRFWVLSWLGAVLVLTGCWLSFPSRVLGFAALVTFGVPVALVVVGVLFA